MTAWIIADSGGSKTDWCLVLSGRVEKQLETQSYHPAIITNDMRVEMLDFWKSHSEWQRYPLYFFGSGCYQNEAQVKMKKLLSELGFKEVMVRSDVQAAAIATLGKSAGWVAILGTGSVLIEWDGNDVVQLIGGKGHEEGDEGSGYYFGRLLIDKYRSGSLNPEQNDSLNNYISQFQVFPERGNEKKQLSSLALSIGSYPEFRPIHEENIRIFLSKYSGNIEPDSVIHFVGSYAASREYQLELVLGEFGFIKGQIVDRPIHRLIEQSRLFID